ncbi:polysaccharide biosynthesis C-terminal domain-containing protein [Balneolaceae bacterium ANBcel3]|nr:polysaccharide biosynthesis C-terminal domain-containing protein [Balneolaceae bacterium ANBcel3]
MNEGSYGTNNGIRNKKSKENLKQRAYLNSVTSLLDYGSKTITGFVVTPFLVTGLGSTLFGVWQMLGQFTSYTGISDIRTTQVLKWTVAKERDSKDEEELREYVTATFVLILLVMPLMLLGGAVLTWFAPIITQVDAVYYSTVRITCALLVMALVTKKAFDPFESVLRGMNLGFKNMGLRAVVFMIGGGLKIAAVLMGYGLIALASVQVLVMATIGVTLNVIVKKHIPWFGFGKFDFKRALSFFKLSGWFMGWTGTKMLLLNTDRVLLGFIAGPVMVTQYVVTKYLINAVRGLIHNVIHGVLPGMGKLYGNGEFDKLHRVRGHMMLLTWLMVTSIGAVIILFNESFLTLWVGEEKYAGATVNILILLSIAQYIFIQNDGAIINITLDITQMVYMGLVSALISIILIFALVPEYGIVGLCTGLIGGRMVMSVGYPWIITKKVGHGIQRPQRFIRPLLVLIILWVGSFFLSGYVPSLNWIYLIAAILIVSLLILIVAYLTGLNKKQRQEMEAYRQKVKFFKSGVN